MSKSREIEVFGMSFMDMISCGLGGVIVLMLIFSTLVNGGENLNGESQASSSESQEQVLRRQELRAQCYFFLEIDLFSPSESDEVFLEYQQEPGVHVDSIRERYLNEKHWKRYVVSYALPEETGMGVFPFILNGSAGKNYSIKIKLFTEDAQEHSFEFDSLFTFQVRKIAADYKLKFKNVK
jgi:hypothetical protein